MDVFTGIDPDVDKDIELDHILPIYRDWETKQANWFKRALTENELIELCEKIVLTLKK